MDATALMYRFKFFETDRDKRKNRKADAFCTYGKATKRGQLLPPSLPLEEMSISNS